MLEKKAASEEMAPAMFEQVTAEYATSRHLVANLIESGFGEDFKVTDLQGIVTAGYVHPMQSDEKIKYGKANVKLHKDATGELVQVRRAARVGAERQRDCTSTAGSTRRCERIVRF